MTAKRQFGAIRRLASGRWQARYRDGGGRMVTAPHTFHTKGDAGRYLATVEADLARGTYVDPRAGQLTLAAWTAEWLASDPSKRATTWARDEYAMRVHFLPALGHRPLASLTPLDVRRAVDALAAKVAPATVRTNTGVLRAVLNAAVEADLIVRSPVRRVKLETAPHCDRPTLTSEELEALAAEVPGRYRVLVLLAGVIGLRWSELVGLRVGGLNFLARTVTISETISEVGGRHAVAITKSKSSGRTLSLPAFLVEELAQHLSVYRSGAGREDLVFTGPKGGTLRRSFAARVFNPAVGRAGLPDALTFHGLRHVAASFLVDAGEHPRVIQHRLGHATARLSMELYAHVPEATDRDVASHLDARFTGGSRTSETRLGAAPTQTGE
ncbi:MAG: tyrosine-type recombinase/integrase [Actinomycetota bacterium]|nr:tyrosine-type recombinase/integrase [Actinomycetota bacterium]